MFEESNFKSIYKINVSEIFGREYVELFNDLSRFIIIQIAIQIMLITVDPTSYSLFSTDFLVLLLFVIIGVLTYWLVFKKIISFT